MNIRKTAIFAAAALAAAATAFAATGTAGQKYGKKGAKAPAAEEEEPSGKGVRVHIEQYPKLGRASTASAPAIGESPMGPAWNGKPRKWIVLEAKYSTQAKCIDQLTFTWHVLLETKSATAKDREGQAKLAPYSYFTQTVTYGNIPRGNHATSVCLHPSYLAQYGEPQAVGIVVSDSNGTELEGNSFSEVKGIKAGTKFWEDEKIMDAKQNGEPMIERRQGLVDRAKTIWGMVNPNDYEATVQ